MKARTLVVCLVVLLSLSARAGGRFEVDLGPELRVEATVEDSQCQVPAFVQDLEIETAVGTWKGLPAGHRIRLQGPTPHHLRYRYDLQEAARVLHSRESVLRAGEVYLAEPSAWLLDCPGPSTLKVRSGGAYLTSLPGLGSDLYQLEEGDPLFAFGPLHTVQISSGGRLISLGFVPGSLKLPDSRLQAWVERTAEALRQYLGRFPVSRLSLLILADPGQEIQGVTYGLGGPSILLQIPKSASAQEIVDSWQLCHEMVHLAIPNLPYSAHWLEEGLASYLEPLVRQLPPERVWGDLMEGLPQTIATVAGQGLDDNHSWEATYWGGSLFCLLADLRLREQSGNRLNLRRALTRVVESGGEVTQSWSLRQMLQTMDQGDPKSTLQQLHQELGTPGPRVNLGRLWSRLGVAANQGRVRFVPAPLDWVRQGITPAGRPRAALFRPRPPAAESAPTPLGPCSSVPAGCVSATMP